MTRDATPADSKRHWGCARCQYQLPAAGEQSCPECGYRGPGVILPVTGGHSHRRFALGAALLIAAVAGLPLLALAVSALLRL